MSFKVVFEYNRAITGDTPYFSHEFNKTVEAFGTWVDSGAIVVNEYYNKSLGKGYTELKFNSFTESERNRAIENAKSNGATMLTKAGVRQLAEHEKADLGVKIQKSREDLGLTNQSGSQAELKGFGGLVQKQVQTMNAGTANGNIIGKFPSFGSATPLSVGSQLDFSQIYNRVVYYYAANKPPVILEDTMSVAFMAKLRGESGPGAGVREYVIPTSEFKFTREKAIKIAADYLSRYTNKESDYMTT